MGVDTEHKRLWHSSLPPSNGFEHDWQYRVDTQNRLLFCSAVQKAILALTKNHERSRRAHEQNNTNKIESNASSRSSEERVLWLGRTSLSASSNKSIYHFWLYAGVARGLLKELTKSHLKMCHWLTNCSYEWPHWLNEIGFQSWIKIYFMLFKVIDGQIHQLVSIILGF